MPLLLLRPYVLSSRFLATPRNAVFASLPLSSLFTVEHVFLDEWAQTHLEPLSDTEATAVYLARMRIRGDSDWDAWVQILPDAFGSFPLFWSDAQLDQLQSSAVRAFTERRLSRARATYASLDPEARSTVPFEQFLWGLSALWSRTHGVAVRDAQGAWQKAAAFVPVADLLNMATATGGAGEGADGGSANVDCKTNDASTHFECFTLRAVPAGQELLVSYGAATPGQPGGSGGGIGNGQLLLDYGFALEQVSTEKARRGHAQRIAPGTVVRIAALQSGAENFLFSRRIAQLVFAVPLLACFFFCSFPPASPFPSRLSRIRTTS